MTKITHLDLSSSALLWKEERQLDSVCKFIKRQQILKTLNLSGNNFTSDTTGRIFLTLIECSSLATLKEVNLDYSADFSSMTTCENFADFIETTPSLKRCFVENQDHAEIQVSVSF